MDKLSVLIIDDEEEIREIISFFLQSSLPCELDYASNGEEAISLLRHKKFDLVICDYNMPIKNGGDVYLFMMEAGLTSRYVLCSSDAPHTFSAYKDLKLMFGFIQKPNIIKGLKETLHKFKTEINREAGAEPLIYNPIGMKLLVALSVMPADIFIKLSDGKYIKAHDSGSIFDETDFIRYEQKGILNLYALNLSTEKIMLKIQEVITQLSSAPNSHNKIQTAFDVQSLIMSTLREYGFQEALLPSIELQIKETIEICGNDKTLNMLMEKMLKMKSSYTAKHSFLLSAITIAIASKLGWNSSPTNHKLVMSSLFHDIFLKDSVENETKSLKVHKESEDFLSHPQKAADLLDKIPRVPPDTGKIILEQHEIGEDQGFPRKMAIYETSPLGQIFTFSHFLVDVILEVHGQGEMDRNNVMKKMELISERSTKYKKLLVLLSEIELF